MDLPFFSVLKWLVLAIASLAMTIANLFLAPVIALFVGADGWLPKWLSWFQTPDNPVDGDTGWRTEHWLWRYRLPIPLSIYVGRVGWLWRNPVYGFAINVLGARTVRTDILVLRGKEKVGNRPLREGWQYRKLYRRGKLIYWQFYYVKKWSDRFCIRINLGWKLWSFSDKESVLCQHVFSPNPFMGYMDDGVNK